MIPRLHFYDFNNAAKEDSCTTYISIYIHVHKQRHSSFAELKLITYFYEISENRIMVLFCENIPFGGLNTEISERKPCIGENIERGTLSPQIYLRCTYCIGKSNVWVCLFLGNYFRKDAIQITALSFMTSAAPCNKSRGFPFLFGRRELHGLCFLKQSHKICTVNPR